MRIKCDGRGDGGSEEKQPGRPARFGTESRLLPQTGNLAGILPDLTGFSKFNHYKSETDYIHSHQF